MKTRLYRAAAGRVVSLVLLLGPLSCGRSPAPESVQSQSLSGGPDILDMHHDISGPLRDTPAVAPDARTHREKPLFPFRAHGPSRNVLDPVLQSGPGPFV